MAFASKAAPAPTVQTVTAYAVIPGSDALSGWTVIKFEASLPKTYERLYENASRSLAAVAVSQLQGRDVLAASPILPKGE